MENTSGKERNTKFIETIMPSLVEWNEIIPIGQLIIFFHSMNGLGLTWGGSKDKHEKRNYEYFKSINPKIEDSLVQAIVSGSFKPESFVHPFEKFHTTSGYQDLNVLPKFFTTVDSLVNSYEKENIENDKFLAFVYIYFLVIHPFVDGNGRVARNLLDYYNQKLSLGFQPVWNNQTNKFSQEAFHLEAFEIFFSVEATIPKYQCNDIYSHEDISSILITRKVELIKLSRYIISQLQEIKSNKQFSSVSINKMAAGISRLQQSDKC